MATSFNSRLSTAPEEGCKAPCVTVSLTNITLSGEQTIGVTAVVTGDRVLVAGQTDSAENGIWVCNSGVWTRAKDWNTAEDVAPGMLIPVSATGEIYQVASFSGEYNPGVTELTLTSINSLTRGVEVQYGSDATAGLFTLTGVTYTPGAKNLEVDHNGQRLNLTIDYTEESTTTVQIVPARVINDDDIFTFRTKTSVSNSITTTDGITHTDDGTVYNLATYLGTLAEVVEGSWTPAVTFITPGNLAVAYTYAVGRYTKLGPRVSVSFRIVTSTFIHSTASGALQITGLPYTSKTVTNLRWCGSANVSGITKAGYGQFVPTILSNATAVYLFASGTAVGLSTVDAADVGTGNITIEGSLEYDV